MSAEPTTVNQKLSELDDPAEVSCGLRPTQTKLCTKCAELGLEQSLARIKPPRESYQIHKFDIKIADVGQSYRKQSDSACNLCHLLSAAHIKVEQDHEDADELHVLNLCDDLSWVSSVAGLREEIWRGQSSLYLAVVPSGFNRSQLHRDELKKHGESNGFLVIRRRGTPQPQVYAPQTINPLFDLSLASHWLQYCKRHHKRLCTQKKTTIAGLHLIDCRSLTVIPAPDRAEYTALSYVWGKPTTDMESSESTARSGSAGIPLPLPIPAVIADAISVITGLGFHYLWVDRYCIDQDSHSKHQQINQMDLIYHHAELTIVAAAGNGPEHGLPGINSRSRDGQLTCTVGDLDLIPTLAHPHKVIASSTWSTRGWTFQEAALSRRRLVFTKDQVYFECKAMNCHETLASNLDKLHIEDKSKFVSSLQVGLFGRTERQKYGSFDESKIKPADNLIRFMGMVEQYTARDLTYDTDSLNAFAGIIRRFETQTTVRQIMGVPFRADVRKTQIHDSFVDGLGWSHKVTGCNNHGFSRRRPGFPSWSWAGWAGEIQYNRSLGNRGVGERSLGGFALYSEVDSVSVETGDGLEVSLSSHVDEAKIVLQETISHSAIYVKALALPASAFSYDNSSTTPTLQVFQFPARLALSTGPWDVPHLYQSLQTADQRKCIYLGHSGSIIVIMVLEAQNDSWSRVGLIFLKAYASGFHNAWKEFKINSRPGIKEARREEQRGEEQRGEEQRGEGLWRKIMWRSKQWGERQWIGEEATVFRII